MYLDNSEKEKEIALAHGVDAVAGAPDRAAALWEGLSVPDRWFLSRQGDGIRKKADRLALPHGLPDYPDYPTAMLTLPKQNADWMGF